MRAPLESVPWDAVDRTTNQPRYGSYRGALRHVDLRVLVPDRLERLARHKRWVWGMVSTNEHAVGFAVVDLGYATSLFAYAWSRHDGMLADHARLGMPGMASVRRDDVHRVRARFTSPFISGGSRATILEPTGSGRIDVDIAVPNLVLSGQGALTEAPSPMTAIAPLDKGLVNVTEKRVLVPFRGAALVHGRRIPLDDAHLGWDVTDGILARRTRWKWAFTQGRLEDGSLFAFNLVEGFVGAPECTLWIGSRPVPVGEGRFVFDRGEPLRPWAVTTECGSIKFEVTPTGMHRDAQDLRVIHSHFVQAIGLGSGVVRHEGKSYAFRDAVTVVEDQDMKW